MPWYQSKPHIWRNFLVFVAISQIWQENFSKYVVWIGTKAYIWRPYYLTIWRVSRKSYIRIYRYMPWYHSQPHIWRYFLVFVAISQIWHIKIHPNSHRLTVLVLSYYLESFKKIVFEDLKKIENSYFLKHLIFDLAIWYSFVESPSETIAAKLSLPHARGTNCTTALASELVESSPFAGRPFVCRRPLHTESILTSSAEYISNIFQTLKLNLNQNDISLKELYYNYDV